MLTEKFMRTGFLLLLAGGAISLSAPACGGKLTNAETRWELGDAASTTTGGGAGGSDDMDGAGGTGATGTGGAGGTMDPDPGGGSGATTGSGGTGGSGAGTTGTTGTTGTGGTGGTGSGTGGGPGDPGGSGGSGGWSVDAGAGCPESQPSNGSTCGQVGLTCGYNNTNCTCQMAGGGGNRSDAGRTNWACAGTTDAGRGGRGAF